MSQETSDGPSSPVHAPMWTPAPTGNHSEVHCLSCNTPLQFAHLGELKVAWCASCSGMMIQRTSLGKAVCDLRSLWTGPEQIPEPVNHDRLTIRRSCPVCFGEMESFLYCGPGNVTLDSCNGCDITWLDGGELRQLIVAPGARRPWAGAPLDHRQAQRELQGMTGDLWTCAAGNPFENPDRKGVELTSVLLDMISRCLS